MSSKRKAPRNDALFKEASCGHCGNAQQVAAETERWCCDACKTANGDDESKPA